MFLRFNLQPSHKVSVRQSVCRHLVLLDWDNWVAFPDSFLILIITGLTISSWLDTIDLLHSRASIESENVALQCSHSSLHSVLSLKSGFWSATYVFTGQHCTRYCTVQHIIVQTSLWDGRTHMGNSLRTGARMDAELELIILLNDLLFSSCFLPTPNSSRLVECSLLSRFKFHGEKRKCFICASWVECRLGASPPSVTNPSLPHGGLYKY